MEVPAPRRRIATILLGPYGKERGEARRSNKHFKQSTSPNGSADSVHHHVLGEVPMHQRPTVYKLRRKGDTALPRLRPQENQRESKKNAKPRLDVLRT